VPATVELDRVLIERDRLLVEAEVVQAVRRRQPRFGRQRVVAGAYGERQRPAGRVDRLVVASEPVERVRK
jgi:hypothetical protein